MSQPIHQLVAKIEWKNLNHDETGDERQSGQRDLDEFVKQALVVAHEQRVGDDRATQREIDRKQNVSPSWRDERDVPTEQAVGDCQENGVDDNGRDVTNLPPTMPLLRGVCVQR